MKRGWFIILIVVTLQSSGIICKSETENQAPVMRFVYIPDVSPASPVPIRPHFTINPFIEKLDLKSAETAIKPKACHDFNLSPAPGIADPLFWVLFHLYGDFYGTAKGDSCLFYPTCSHYSRLCIHDYGLVQGMWMTFGRLARSHTNSDGYYPVVIHPEGIRYFDPPEHERIELYLSHSTEVRFDTEFQIN